MRALVVICATVLGLGLMAAPASAGGHMPPGKTIQEACGVSFGQLIGPAKAAGTATHDNYKGGAKALVPLAAAHGCG